MSFWKKIGRGLGKVVKTVGPLAALVPGVGSIVATAAPIVGQILDPEKQEAMVSRVAEQGVIRVDKVEQTIAKQQPQMSAVQVQQATQQTVQALAQAVPTAKIDDGKAVTKVGTFEKITQWVKSNIIIVIGGVVGLFFLLRDKRNGRRRW